MFKLLVQVSFFSTLLLIFFSPVNLLVEDNIYTRTFFSYLNMGRGPGGVQTQCLHTPRGVGTTEGSLESCIYMDIIICFY